MDKDEYILDCWQKARDYQKNVLDGSIITNENIKLAVKRLQSDYVRPLS